MIWEIFEKYAVEEAAYRSVIEGARVVAADRPRISAGSGSGYGGHRVKSDWHKNSWLSLKGQNR